MFFCHTLSIFASVHAAFLKLYLTMIQSDSNPIVPQFVVRNYDVSPVPVYVDTTVSFFFVLLDGEISVAYDSVPALTVRPGDSLMVMRHSCYRMTVVKPSVGLRIIHTDYFAESCHRAFGNLADYLPHGFEYVFRALPCTPAIIHFLRCVHDVIADGKATPRMHSQWSGLFTDMVAAYYTGAQVAGFLYPLMSDDYDFRNLVIEHSLHVGDLNELADICRMSLSTFKRRFKRTFHSPAHSWIAARKAHFIYSEIINTKKTFVEIAGQFNISSSAYLTAFCKQHFGITPQEIRRRSNMSVAAVGRNDSQ